MIQRTIFAIAICAGHAAFGGDTGMIGDGFDCRIVDISPPLGGYFHLTKHNLVLSADDTRVVGWNEAHSQVCLSADGVACLFVPIQEYNNARNALEVSLRL